MKKCPNCSNIMNEVIKINVIIDVCPSCMGIWLDKGELEKIMSIIERDDLKSDKGDNYRSRKDNRKDSYFDDDYDRSKRYEDDEDHRYYDNRDKNGYPRKKKGGLSDIFGNLFD